MLNIIWGVLIIAGIAAVFVKSAVLMDSTVISEAVKSLFHSASVSMDIVIGLAGMMCFWLGLSRVMEKSGITSVLARLITPLFRVIMPGVPAGHPAIGSMTMNLAANMLGLDNAATPLGIRAMKDLETLNTNKGTATDSEIMFLVINTSAVTIFPVSVFLYRSKFGSAAPTDVFLPILLATICSTIAGFLAVAFCQKISLLKAPLLAFFAALIGLAGGVALWASFAGASLAAQATAVSDGLLLFFIGFVLVYGLTRKVKIYDEFVAGAKEGFKTTIDILPYLVAMLAAVAVFRAGGLLEAFTGLVKSAAAFLGFDTAFADALPVSLVKPLSGSGARAMMLDVFESSGVDSFAGHVASVMQGSTETTFYVLAVYFGAVGITRVRHAVWCGLFADFTSMIASIVISYVFFGSAA